MQRRARKLVPPHERGGARSGAGRTGDDKVEERAGGLASLRFATHLSQGRCELGRQQHVTRLVALADDRELDLARLARQHLAPGEARELRDAQRASIGDLEREPVAARLRGTEQEMPVHFRQEPLRAPALHLPDCNKRRRVEAAIIRISDTSEVN